MQRTATRPIPVARDAKGAPWTRSDWEVCAWACHPHQLGSQSACRKKWVCVNNKETSNAFPQSKRMVFRARRQQLAIVREVDTVNCVVVNLHCPGFHRHLCISARPLPNLLLVDRPDVRLPRHAAGEKIELRDHSTMDRRRDTHFSSISSIQWSEGSTEESEMEGSSIMVQFG